MRNLAFALLTVVFLSCTSKEEKEYVFSVTQERSIKNNEFVADGSPLENADLGVFSGLKYFPVNMDFKFSGLLEPFQKPESVLLEQGDTVKRMLRYGKAVFNIRGDEVKLTIYKSMANPFAKEGDNELFVPFFDETNGLETYEGGRYIYPELQGDGTLIIDFNKASNPYCAYNHAYNCVVPPFENSVPFKINAGEKSYH